VNGIAATALGKDPARSAPAHHSPNTLRRVLSRCVLAEAPLRRLSRPQEGSRVTGASRFYLHGGRVDEIVASFNQAAGWAFHHYDLRNHCIMLTDGSGNLLEQYEYDAFGQPYFYNAAGANVGSSAFGNRFLFQGREWLADLKLYDYRNRLYQPRLGRFLQPDPVGMQVEGATVRARGAVLYESRLTEGVREHGAESVSVLPQ
jgi:RHS repeat-associated protein